MSVLLAVNDGLTTKGITSDKEAKIIVKKYVSIWNLTPGFNAAEQFGIDHEAVEFEVGDD